MIWSADVLSALLTRLRYGGRSGEVDPVFYRAYYRDLRHLESDAALRRHFERHGKAEGRHPSEGAFLGTLHGRFEPAEPGFDAEEYLAANPDLRDVGVDNRWMALAHYLRHGRGERRLLRRFDPDIYRDLYFPGSGKSDRDLYDHFIATGQRRGLIATGKALLLSKGVSGSGERWIERLKIDEFRQLNHRAAPGVRSKVEAIDWMLAHGIALIAPIAFNALFDPAFVRDYDPAASRSSDADLYRRWLFVGLENEAPGSAQEVFDTLKLSLTAYPATFNWRLHMGRTGKPRSRWQALRWFVEAGAPNLEASVADDPASAPFLRALATRFAGADPALVLRLTERIRRHGALTMRDRLAEADAYFRQERFRLALAGYLPILREHPAAAINAARAALRVDKALAALAVLRVSKDKVVGSSEWRKVLDEAIDHQFGVAAGRADELLRVDRRSDADRVMREAVHRVVDHYGMLDPLGVRMPAAGPPRIVMLANVDLRQCTHYRVEQKQRLFELAGVPYEIYPADEVEDFIAALTGATMAIFYRLPARPPNIRAITVARAFGIPTFYDIDDLIFDSTHYPEPLDTYGDVSPAFYRSLRFGVPLFRAAMGLCDYGIASTTALARHVAPVVRRHDVFVWPNVLDERNDVFAVTPPLRVRRDDAVVLFYGSGTKAHNSDFLDLAGPALLQALRCHPDVELVIVGFLSLDERFDAFAKRIVTVDLLPDVNGYWSLLAEADVNLAVLVPGPTTDPKSEIKWLEAAVMGIPSVVSATDRYREILTHGADAMVAATPEDWTASVEALVADPTLRKRIGAAARAKAVRDHGLASNLPVLRTILDFAGRHADLRPARKGRKRLLLANIFFPPQTIGGSTRVVRDNVDALLDTAADEFDIAILTSDFGNEGTGRMRVEDYRGCPVFRVSTPKLPEMEWWAFHDSLRPTFRGILEAWSPDLVHFHCVERLSASVVYETLRAGVPYIVTCHDAWWVSDWHFLNDHRSRLREPGERYPTDGPNGVSMGESIDRLRELKPLLDGAAEILAVSKAFTALYRACGFERTRCVANGVPPLALAPRRPGASGKVRLAHVGSMTKFKGYHLLEAALRQSRFANLELTVVDHARYGGEVRETLFGATRVMIVGKTIQEEMHTFYAGQDVLVAPSLWPEPFGLVTREALTAGLWVLASDRGAIGEDVSPGLNGWVVDVATPGPIIDALAAIDRDPGRYLASPPPVRLRTARDQADDLRAIYHAVLARPRSRGDATFRTVRRAHEPPAERAFDARRRREREIGPDMT